MPRDPALAGDPGGATADRSAAGRSAAGRDVADIALVRHALSSCVDAARAADRALEQPTSRRTSPRRTNPARRRSTVSHDPDPAGTRAGEWMMSFDIPTR